MRGAVPKLWSKLLVAPFRAPIVVPDMIPYISPCIRSLDSSPNDCGLSPAGYASNSCWTWRKEEFTWQVTIAAHDKVAGDFKLKSFVPRDFRIRIITTESLMIAQVRHNLLSSELTSRNATWDLLELSHCRNERTSCCFTTFRAGMGDGAHFPLRFSKQ